MSAIVDAIMNDDTAVSAVCPLYACDIALLEKYAICLIASVVSEPGIQIYLHSSHFASWIASIGCEGIGLAVNLQYGHWPGRVTAVRNLVVGPGYCSNCSNLVTQCAGDPVCH